MGNEENGPTKLASEACTEHLNPASAFPWMICTLPTNRLLGPLADRRRPYAIDSYSDWPAAPVDAILRRFAKLSFISSVRLKNAGPRPLLNVKSMAPFTSKNNVRVVVVLRENIFNHIDVGVLRPFGIGIVDIERSHPFFALSVSNGFEESRYFIATLFD